MQTMPPILPLEKGIIIEIFHHLSPSYTSFGISVKYDHENSLQLQRIFVFSIFGGLIWRLYTFPPGSRFKFVCKK